jgi:hypothetical protein
MEGGTAKKILKQLLGLWAIGYPIISILPLLSTGTSTTGATAVGGLASLIVASALLGPWIIGIIILGILVLVAPSPTPVIRRASDDEDQEDEHADAIWPRLARWQHRDDAAPSAGPLDWDPERHQWLPSRVRNEPKAAIIIVILVVAVILVMRALNGA